MKFTRRCTWTRKYIVCGEHLWTKYRKSKFQLKNCDNYFKNLLFKYRTDLCMFVYWVYLFCCIGKLYVVTSVLRCLQSSWTLIYIHLMGKKLEKIHFLVDFFRFKWKAGKNRKLSHTNFHATNTGAHALTNTLSQIAREWERKKERKSEKELHHKQTLHTDQSSFVIAIFLNGFSNLT